METCILFRAKWKESTGKRGVRRAHKTATVQVSGRLGPGNRKGASLPGGHAIVIANQCSSPGSRDVAGFLNEKHDQDRQGTALSRGEVGGGRVREKGC